jgi:hypothetical protein
MHSKSRGTLRRDGRAEGGQVGRQAGELLVAGGGGGDDGRAAEGGQSKVYARARIAGMPLGKRTVKHLAAV